MEKMRILHSSLLLLTKISLFSFISFVCTLYKPILNYNATSLICKPLKFNNKKSKFFQTVGGHYLKKIRFTKNSSSTQLIFKKQFCVSYEILWVCVYACLPVSLDIIMRNREDPYGPSTLLILKELEPYGIISW